MAAVLALGEGAAVTHQSAAALWEMLRSHDGPIEVTVPGDNGRETRKGIKIHRSSTFIGELKSQEALTAANSSGSS